MESFRLTQLEIHGVGPFGDLTLDFQEKPAGMEGKAEIHILTGENGTGKTTILEMLASFVGERLGVSNVISRLRNDHGSFVVKSKDKSWNFIPTHFSKNDLTGLGEEYLSAYLNNQPFTVAYFVYSGFRNINSTKFHNIKELTTHPFKKSLSFQDPVNEDNLFSWIANTISKEAIEKSQNNLDRAQQYRESLSRIESAIESIINKPVRFVLETEVLQVAIELEGQRLGFDMLPDGLKSIISWIADLLMRMDRVKWVDHTPVLERPFILFLDEIEVHLHPAWQRKILPAVQNLFPNAQIFISTHSPFVVGSVDGAWIYKFEKPNGDSKLAPGYPKPSEDAHSYRYWLEEVFGIKEAFGQQVSTDMDGFYALRGRMLSGENGTTTEDFLQSGRQLAQQSIELNQIIEMEIRQLNRKLGLNLQL
jgi:uncharacterized protein YhaN